MTWRYIHLYIKVRLYFHPYLNINSEDTYYYLITHHHLMIHREEKPHQCTKSIQYDFVQPSNHSRVCLATRPPIYFCDSENMHMLMWPLAIRLHLALCFTEYLYDSVPTRSRISLCCHQAIHRFVQPTGYPYHMFVRLSGHPCSEFAYLYVLLLSIITNIILNLKPCTKKSF